MRFLIPHLLTALIFFIVNICMNGGNHSDEKDKYGNYIVQYPKMYFIIGATSVFGNSLLLVLMYLFPNTTAKLWVYCVFFTFIVIGLFLMYSTIVWKITFSDENVYFEYRSLLLRTKRFWYKECYFQFETDCLIVGATTYRAKIRIPKVARGYDHFARIIRQKAKMRR